MSDHAPSPIARLIHYGILAGPAALLGSLALRYDSRLLAIGAVAELLGAALFLRRGLAWRPPTSASVILLYLMGLGWCWFHTRELHEPPAAFARGMLLLVPVGLLFAHDLARTGAEARRQARRNVQRLRRRRDWPADPAQIPRLHEVRALRDVLKKDASPLFGLFNDPRPEVRMAAFAALEGYKHWRPSEIAVVLHKLHQMSEPAVRAMAITALAPANEPNTALELARFLRDPEPSVRLAAIRAAITNPGQRWAVVRESVRAYLADSRFANDGGLPGAASRLPAVAVCDLTAWAMEPEPLGSRSIRALIEHFAHRLHGEIDYDLVSDLSGQIIDPNTPAGLRVEIAHLMRTFRLLTPDLLDRMTNLDQPGPIRLLAAEAMLAQNPTDSDALDVLRGLGRQPNRELALGVAKVLQEQLGFDMGLPADRLSLQSRTAGDIVKRVQQWATARSTSNSANPTPGYPMPGLPPETPPPLGLVKTGPPGATAPGARQSWRK
ncbi:MAG: HEAT repeat domain-containing protein [Gemmataceae bacterium]|nr:HEAT repeat domain-containing protein [Gemmataceae bacterium]